MSHSLMNCYLKWFIDSKTVSVRYCLCLSLPSKQYLTEVQSHDWFFDSQKNPREKLKCQSSIYKKEFAKVSNKIWVIWLIRKNESFCSRKIVKVVFTRFDNFKNKYFFLIIIFLIIFLNIFFNKFFFQIHHFLEMF